MWIIKYKVTHKPGYTIQMFMHSALLFFFAGDPQRIC